MQIGKKYKKLSKTKPAHAVSSVNRIKIKSDKQIINKSSQINKLTNQGDHHILQGNKYRMQSMIKSHYNKIKLGRGSGVFIIMKTNEPNQSWENPLTIRT